MHDDTPVLPPYYHITFGKALLGFGDGAPINIFVKAHAQGIRGLLVADLIADGTMPKEEAESLVKVVQVTE